MSGHKGAAVLSAACAAMLACLSNDAMARTPPPDQAIPTAQQVSRDIERLRILQDELARERTLAAEAARRRAERLAAADARGAQEAELINGRSSQNIEALQREIKAAATAASRHTNSTAATAPSAVQPVSARSNATGQVRWWDVYAKPPQAAAQEAVSVSPVAQPLGVRTFSASTKEHPDMEPLIAAPNGGMAHSRLTRYPTQIHPNAAGGGNHAKPMEATP